MCPDSPDIGASDAAPLRPASAAEVAALAGVSRSAVSRTFTDGASVSERTRAKVLAAAKELNYHVNHLARGLSKDESRPVCLLASNLTKPYHGLLLDALTRRLQAAGRMAMVVNVTADPDGAQVALERALRYRASASIVMSGTPAPEMVASCIAAGQKVIAINRGEAWPGVVHIRIDYRQAMERAADMFLRAGCRTVAILGSDKGTPSLAARQGFLASALGARGMRAEMWRARGSGYAEGLAAAEQLAAPPDGVFCVTDLLACGLMDGARQRFGLQIPEDLSVLGFDDIPQAGWAGYQLTTFAQPYDEIAHQAEAALREGRAPAPLMAQPVWRATMRAPEADRA